MNTSFFAINLTGTYGGWVLFRDGEIFARTFENKKQAKNYAKQFCELNGIAFVWTR